MSSVKEVNSVNQRSLQTLQRKNKSELDHLSKKHELDVEDIKKAHDKDIHQLRDANQIEIAEEVQKKEETLNALKGSIDKTKQITEAEVKRQQIHSNRLKEENQQKTREEIENINFRHEDLVQDLNQRQNSNLRDLNEESQLKMKDMQDTNRMAFSNEGEQWRGKINQQRQVFAESYRSEGEKYDHVREKQKTQHKHLLHSQHRKSEQELSQLSEQTVKRHEEVKTHHQKSLVEKENLFEKKYQDQLAKHGESEKNLEGMHSKVLDSAKESLNKRVEIEQNRSNDSFFNFTELRPTIEEQPGQYILRVKVPEYSKEEVLLSSNHKELVLTSNRRYQDERKDADGTMKKVNKVESMTSRIPVSQVLDARKMTKEWKDGELIFTVKKA
ncbi:MAG: hypothetical protein K2P81_01160 [Bacteriovoracaceae bacterium]|nr:hypothetical protein [Bacteriovoracaceae bacterium]